MDQQAASLFLSILGLIVSIGIPLAGYRISHPHRQVSYHLEHVPVSRESLSSAEDARDLCIVKISMWSSGRADVPSASFDDGRPIVFRFSAAIRDDLAPSIDDEVEGWGLERSGSNQVLFRPSLLGRGAVFTSQVVVPQPVRYWVRHPLVDVAVILDRRPPAGGIERAASGKSRLKLSGLAIGFGLIAFGFSSTIVSIALFEASQTLGILVDVLGSLLLWAGIITVIVSAIVRLVKWISGRRKRAEIIDPLPA